MKQPRAPHATHLLDDGRDDKHLALKRRQLDFVRLLHLILLLPRRLLLAPELLSRVFQRLGKDRWRWWWCVGGWDTKTGGGDGGG